MVSRSVIIGALSEPIVPVVWEGVGGDGDEVRERDRERERERERDRQIDKQTEMFVGLNNWEGLLNVALVRYEKTQHPLIPTLKVIP